MDDLTKHIRAAILLAQELTSKESNPAVRAYMIRMTAETAAKAYIQKHQVTDAE